MIRNFTPHPIVLRAADGTDHTFPSEGVARVSATPGALEDVEGVPVPVAGGPPSGRSSACPTPSPGSSSS